MSASPMLLLIDENVPDDVADAFRDRGHRVMLVRDYFLLGTPDHIVAKAADQQGAIVVTWNHKHFHRFMARKRADGSPTYPKLGLVTYEVREPEGLRRTLDYLTLIEHAYGHCAGREGARLFVHIGATFARVLR